MTVKSDLEERVCQHFQQWAMSPHQFQYQVQLHHNSPVEYFWYNWLGLSSPPHEKKYICKPPRVIESIRLNACKSVLAWSDFLILWDRMSSGRTGIWDTYSHLWSKIFLQLLLTCCSQIFSWGADINTSLSTNSGYFSANFQPIDPPSPCPIKITLECSSLEIDLMNNFISSRIASSEKLLGKIGTYYKIWDRKKICFCTAVHFWKNSVKSRHLIQ